MNYYISAITKNFANFDGRARRTEYWMFVLFNFIVTTIISFISALTGIYFLPLLYSLIVLIPWLAISVRRLHDIDKSGVWIFINLIPIIGLIWILILTLTEGTNGSNKYGEDPKPY